MKTVESMLSRAAERNTVHVHWNPEGYWEVTDLSGKKHRCTGRLHVQDKAQAIAEEAGRQLFIDWHDNTKARVVNP